MHLLREGALGRLAFVIAEFHRDRSDLHWQRRDPATNAVSRLGDIQNQVLASRIAANKSAGAGSRLSTRLHRGCALDCAHSGGWRSAEVRGRWKNEGATIENRRTAALSDRDQCRARGFCRNQKPISASKMTVNAMYVSILSSECRTR